MISILPGGVVINSQSQKAYVGGGEVEIKTRNIRFFHYLDTVKCTYASTACDQPVIQNSEDVLSSKPCAIKHIEWNVHATT